MERAFSIFTVALALTFPFTAVAVDRLELEEKQKILDMITKTAHEMCYVVSNEFESTTEDIEGQVNAKLSGLAAKFGEAGLQGAAKLTTKKSKNVLQEQLAKSIGDSAACNVGVLNSLKDVLFDIKNNHTNKNNPTKKEDSDINAVNPETDATRVHSFEFITPPTEIKPGIRQWRLLASNIWEEKYPDGTKANLYCVKRIHIADCDGTVVSGKFDKDFQVFFPDRNCDTKELLFRRLSQGHQWHSYVQIQTMK